MRELGVQEIEDIALGAALLGAGGGGDPYIGKLTAIGAVKECGPVKMIGIDEVPDGSFIMPAASMGAPSILATTPDLICLVDTETFRPVPTDALKYGKRVLVVGLECFHLWRTQAGLDLVGPRYFGIDADYIPIEELAAKRGGGHV